MTAAEAFEYAVLRVVPRVDRGETMNAGVVLYCRPRGYLGTRLALDEGLLLSLDPQADVAGVRRALDAMAALCTDGAPVSGGAVPGGVVSGGVVTAGGGPGGAGPYRAGSGGPGVAGGAAAQDIGRRFRWLTAPRSTVVQAGPVHTGLTRDPAAEIDRLLRSLVLRPR